MRLRNLTGVLEADMGKTSTSAFPTTEIPGNRSRWMSLVRVCSLCILSVPAFAEKGTLESEWFDRIAEHRNSLGAFEIWTETWRYEIFDTNAPVSAERSEEWVRSVRDRIRSASDRNEPEQAFSLLVEAARDFFESPPASAEVLSEVHQRDSETGAYRVWERRTGALSLYDPMGTWHQSDGVIAIGPVISKDTIEVFLARHGVLIPQSAKALEVPSATPEDEDDFLILQVDSNDLRYRYACRPWKREGVRPVSLEEYPLIEEEEGSLTERRSFFRFSDSSAPETPLDSLPEAAIEFRYGARGELISYALIRIHEATIERTQWMPFPSSRPPFGWKVLDYRFLPENEFIFGQVR